MHLLFLCDVVGSLPGFGIGVIVTLKKQSGNVPSVSILQTYLRSISINSSLTVWLNLCWIHLVQGFWIGRFLITDFISLGNIDLLKLFIWSWFKLWKIVCIKKFILFNFFNLVEYRLIHYRLIISLNFLCACCNLPFWVFSQSFI